jgi:hypothetical protein
LQNPLLPSIPIPFLLKEGERQGKDWSAIQSRIPNLRTVFEKNRAFVSEVLSTGREAEAILFSEKGEGGLSGAEKVVYYHLDGRRNVRQLGRLAGLDTYSTCRALVQLESRGIATLKSLDRPEVPVGPSVVQIAVQAVGWLVLGGLVTWLLLVQPGTFQVLRGQLPIDMAFVTNLQREGADHQVRRAMQAMLLRKLNCPESLEEAEELGLLDSKALSTKIVLCDPGQGFAVVDGEEDGASARGAGSDIPNKD